MLSNPRTTLVLAVGICLSALPLGAGYSPDEPPNETPLDPGDVFLVSGVLEVDDTCPPIPPFPTPCLGVPNPEAFDLDAFSVDNARVICPPMPPPNNPGVLFSLDDGDPGPGSGAPDRAIELLFYDRCGLFSGGSFETNADEIFLTLGANPPPTGSDDDVDAYETADAGDQWGLGGLVFSPDSPSDGLLGPDPGCPGSSPAGTLYFSDSGNPGLFYATPCTLGVPDVEDCDIDAVTVVRGEPEFPQAPVQLLFSTDDQQPCGLDPGDIYISDNAGSSVLWADDVTDLRIARNENEDVDIDALSVNEDGPINPGNPFVPPTPITWKRDWPDYAPSGMPDFSQDHANFDPTLCGPTAVADALWWIDSQAEGRCGGGPGDGVDDFPLVEGIATPDDHMPDAVEPLILDLAACMMTDPGTGTTSTNMQICIDQWLAGRGLSSLVGVRRVDNPSFGELACAVERSESVIVRLGFWNNPGSRCGGHFVTASGVRRQRDPGADGLPGQAGLDDDSDGEIDEDDEICPCGPLGPTAFGDDVCSGPSDEIVFSDPGLNNAEAGGGGRVRGPAHGAHAPVAAPPPDHDDALNLSHDLYPVGPSGTGNFQHGLIGYAGAGGGPTPCPAIERWCGQNSDEENEFDVCIGPNVEVEVESMIAVALTVTDVCIDIRNGMNDLQMHKGACPAPASTPSSYDYVRGELCQLSESPPQVDLGEVDCLYDDDPGDQVADNTAWDATSGIGSWFYVAREDVVGCDYGTSSSGSTRNASAGDCPCP